MSLTLTKKVKGKEQKKIGIVKYNNGPKERQVFNTFSLFSFL
jgi:hypothetical protein